MMTRKTKMDGQRQGSTESSSAESWISQDTVRAADGASRFAPKRLVKPDKRPSQFDDDLGVSPGTVLTPQIPRSQIAPWDDPSDKGDYRKESSTSQGSNTSVPTISRQPPSGPSSAISPWTEPQYSRKNRPSQMISSVFGAGFNYDSGDDLPQSPGALPHHGFPDYGRLGEDRRPSVASTATMSSTGSKRSIGGISNKFHKKLQGFFGEEYNDESRQNSDASTPGDLAPKERNNSVNGGGAPSPVGSRPRTPAPSSEVTPWVFQDSKDLPQPPDFPFPDQSQTAAPSARTAKGSTAYNHRLHLPGHRHNRSNEESKPSIVNQAAQQPRRPSTSREQSFSGNLRTSDGQSSIASVSTLRPRATSPTPSMSSAQSRDGPPQKSPGHPHSTKRSLFNRVTGRHKGEKASGDTLKNLPSSTASLPSAAKPPGLRQDSAVAQQSSKIRKITGGPDSRNVHAPPGVPTSKKEQQSRLPFIGGKRADPSTQWSSVKDPNAKQPEIAASSSLWHLDTDMSRMEGIIDRRQPPMTPPTEDIFAGGYVPDIAQPPAPDEAGAWDAPDSWAVKRVTDANVARLRELDDSGQVPGAEDPGPMYFMRVFRADSTFAVISAGLNTTAAELIQMMAKKTFLQDELDTYQIVMRKEGSSRQLDSGERPLVMQTRLLQQAGYEDKDRLEDIGREDHGYLCRFTFLPGKLSGYSSLDRDPGFNRMQKFNHIDLSGRNLITIPITLYQKATEIIALNLSRNLSLDIPKDFIQSCINLREIKYTSNEAWKLPASLALASKLTMLDVSNNRLEQLEHAELNRLFGLISLKLSNNKLTQLPPYFSQFYALRSVNIASNSLQEFPEMLCELTTLVDLDVSFNHITRLPDIGKLVHLERFFATNNKLAGTLLGKTNFKNLVKLNQIDVRFNYLDNIDLMSQLPSLEHLMIGHNSISAFEGSLTRIRVLFLNHNPVTRFSLVEPAPALSVLNLASAKLVQLSDTLFQMVPGLTKLVLDKNHFVTIPHEIGKLTKLEHLSIAKNLLAQLPPDIGRLSELKYLDVRENNLNTLPPEIWFAKKLETLNVSSNVLSDFPKPGMPLPPLQDETVPTPAVTPGSVSEVQEFDELGKLEGFQMRRPSQISGGTFGSASSPSSSARKVSVASSSYSGGLRNPSLARSTTESTIGTITPVSRKDSTLSSRLASTFAQSLRHLILADNRLSDDVFDELVLLTELRMLNLSWNELYDLPPRTIKRWQHLTELYLSGNDITSLPAEDLEEHSSLRVLHLNSNKFQVLPAELCKVGKLQALDVGSNMLKYNVCNWPYDWNWNWNRQLRYLNMSGNKRLEIKPDVNSQRRGDERDLTDFSQLSHLRVLGLMDVTLTIPSIPDETPDRRIRTAGSMIGTSMPYGMADTLGRYDHLSTIDMVIPQFQGHEDQTLVGMFDGQALGSGGSKVAKYLHEKFRYHFMDELDKLRKSQDETPVDALRRAYLGLNKELATAATQTIEAKESPSAQVIHRGSVGGPELSEDEINSGAVATVIYLHGMELYVSNVGDAQALLIQSEGGHRVITQKHDPAEASERQRIRDAGGFVSRQGKLNDVLEVSRAFGYVSMTPCVIAAPHVSHYSIKESDEIILIASRELWDYLTPDFAVDVARSERTDLMRAAQKLRDLAIAFGANGKIMVMMIGVSDLRKRERARFRTHSMSMGPTGSPDDYFTTRRKARGRDNVGDSKLARLDQEVDAPQGEVSLVFTDIKNSTMLWETYPIAMRSAIKMHNEVMRRQLRIIGGYEVKTEGDAFMVAFPTVTSALLWCFTIQSQLLEVQWPQEILSSVHGQEVVDADNQVIFRGLSVRMGIHWGHPVCEVDPVTKRMDYFGPMVNRASRISSVADGGQITVSADFIAEIQRLLETHIESDRTGSTGSDDTTSEDVMSATIRRELRSLSSQGFEVKDLGQRTLKGLENPEYIYLMYPHSLASRLVVQQQRADESHQTTIQGSGGATKSRNSTLTIETDHVWDLWNVSLRLEMLCSSLESTGVTGLKAPETALLERMRERGGEITDRFLINFVEHQISRIETCVTTLALRNMVKPFKPGMMFKDACPMGEILNAITSQLDELKMLKEQA